VAPSYRGKKEIPHRVRKDHKGVNGFGVQPLRQVGKAFPIQSSKYLAGSENGPLFWLGDRLNTYGDKLPGYYYRPGGTTRS
jgi:hypothetical protein